MSSSFSYTFLLLLQLLLVIGLLQLLGIQVVEARRRDPFSESASAFDGGEGRTTSSALLRDSTKGTRSVIGKNVNVPTPNGPDDHLVTDLPLLDTTNNDFKDTKHWAGLLPVNDKGDGYLFYWLFAPDPTQLEKAKQDGRVKEDESNVPLVIWLNGGPACSSMDGLWIENGPFRLNPGSNGNNKDWENIEIDPNSWHNAPAYVLYIDQPVGTGLAFTTSRNFPKNDDEVNKDFYYFLTEFVKLHSTTLGVTPKDYDGNNSKQSSAAVTTVKTLQRPFFFSGESHAGHYIPSMMNYIRKRNLELSKLQSNDGVVIPLSGAAIGNGWFDPFYQYSAHEAAYGYGLIGKAQERSLAAKEEVCRADLTKKKYTSDTCFGLLNTVVTNSLGKTNPSTVSQYDQRKWESRSGSRDFPAGHKDVEAYLGQAQKISNANVQDVLKSIHAVPSWESGQRYRECTDPPYNALSHQDGLGVVQDIVELLEADDDDDDETTVRLLFFNGVHDLICNHVGNENALENLPWKHQTEFIESQRSGWKSASTNQLGGYIKEYQNLQFLKVLNSGHMVPMDVPEVALDMLKTFIFQESFQSYNQQIKGSSTSSSNAADCPACPKQRECDKNNNNNNNVDCPVCEDSSSSSSLSSCSKMECENKFHLSADDGTSMVVGMVWGVAICATLVGITYFCWTVLSCCGIKSSSAENKYGSVELSNTNNTNNINNSGMMMMNSNNNKNGYTDESDNGKNSDDEDDYDNKYGYDTDDDDDIMLDDVLNDIGSSDDEGSRQIQRRGSQLA